MAYVYIYIWKYIYEYMYTGLHVTISVIIMWVLQLDSFTIRQLIYAFLLFTDFIISKLLGKSFLPLWDSVYLSVQ